MMKINVMDDTTYSPTWRTWQVPWQFIFFVADMAIDFVADATVLRD